LTREGNVSNLGTVHQLLGDSTSPWCIPIDQCVNQEASTLDIPQDLVLPLGNPWTHASLLTVHIVRMLSRLTLRVLHHALLKSFEVEALKAVYFYLNDVLLVVKLCHEDAVGVELPVRNSFAPCVPHDLEELFCYHGDMVLAQVTPLLANEWQEAWRVHILTDQGHLLVTHKYVLKADDPFVLQLQQIRKLFNVVFSN